MSALKKLSVLISLVTVIYLNIATIQPAAALSVIGDCVSGVENGARKTVTVTLQTTITVRDHSTQLINTATGATINPVEGSEPTVYVFNNVPEGEWFIQCESCCVLPASPSPSASASATP